MEKKSVDWISLSSHIELGSFPLETGREVLVEEGGLPTVSKSAICYKDSRKLGCDGWDNLGKSRRSGISSSPYQ
ncbi:hypothetical protein L195_g009076 [Trifolium pratense]|uniref:Uncharacterized protein n=1 Tax=Trifolium pratense TaxID=57577 RepID=A0A2K3PAZ5_TRIPR|nr:hypothetical protein L195_g009076 [Trifolium pratense]